MGNFTLANSQNYIIIDIIYGVLPPIRLYYYPPQCYNNIGNLSQHPLISNSLNNNNSYIDFVYKQYDCIW